MMDYDGANQTRLTFNTVKDISPAWSPDQKRIAYTSYQSLVAGLYILDVYEGQAHRRLDPGRELLAGLVARREEARLLLDPWTGTPRSTSPRSKPIPTRVGKIKRLTFNQAIDTAPSWSPTGRQIVFISDRGGTPQIYTMDAEGGNVARVSFGGSNHHDSPAWSPAGDRIVYVARVDNVFDLYVLQPPQPADPEADRIERPERVAVLVARRPAHRLHLEHEGRAPAVRDRLRRGQPPPAHVPGQEQLARLGELSRRGARYFPSKSAVPEFPIDLARCSLYKMNG